MGNQEAAEGVRLVGLVTPCLKSLESLVSRRADFDALRRPTDIDQSGPGDVLHTQKAAERFERERCRQRTKNSHIDSSLMGAVSVFRRHGSRADESNASPVPLPDR